MKLLPDELHDQILAAETIEAALPALECLLSNGYSVTPNGELYFIKELVGRINGLSIYIYLEDHPPPHFHIRGGGLNASFSISDCTLLKGQASPRHQALIKWWHRRAHDKLQATWEKLSG